MMADRPLDEAAALEWLRSQPGGRTTLPAAELGRRWGWHRQRAGRQLKAWAKAGLVTLRGDATRLSRNSRICSEDCNADIRQADMPESMCCESR